jgi:hypothetical protein
MNNLNNYFKLKTVGNESYELDSILRTKILNNWMICFQEGDNMWHNINGLLWMNGNVW